MADIITCTLPLTRWQGDRGTYHLVTITGEQAENITMHARLHRLEYGHQRGFGSVKVIARIGEAQWKSSVFPQKDPVPSSSEASGQNKTTPSSSEASGPHKTTPSSSEAPAQNKTWILLVSKKVMKAQDLAAGEMVTLELELL